MKRTSSLIAAVLVIGMAATASAEFATGGTIIAGVPPLVEVTPNNFANIGSDSSGNALDVISAIPIPLVITTTGYTSGSQLNLQIWARTVTNFTLTGVTFTDGVNSAIYAFPVGLAMTANTFTNYGFNLNAFNAVTNPFGVTATVGAFTTYNQINLIFTPGLGVGAFQLNAVANPEPGTMALFALGAMGLGGLVMRRRRRKLPISTEV